MKFREGTGIRLRGGRPQDPGASPGIRDDLEKIRQQIPADLWRRGHSVSEERLTQLRTEGMAKSGRVLPDLNLYQRLELPGHLNAWQAKRILERFDAVEAAYIVPRPAPLPAAPDYTSSGNPSGSWQGYLGPNPGIDAQYAWSLNLNGDGIRVCDVESDFNADQQDLPPVTIVGEAPVQSTNLDDNGKLYLRSWTTGLPYWERSQESPKARTPASRASRSTQSSTSHPDLRPVDARLKLNRIHRHDPSPVGGLGDRLLHSVAHHVSLAELPC